MTTPLFLLRCVQLGLNIRDLDLLTIGMVNDMYAESGNDDYPYKQLATQKDFDSFEQFLWDLFGAYQRSDSIGLRENPPRSITPGRVALCYNLFLLARF